MFTTDVFNRQQNDPDEDFESSIERFAAVVTEHISETEGEARYRTVTRPQLKGVFIFARPVHLGFSRTPSSLHFATLDGKLSETDAKAILDEGSTLGARVQTVYVAENCDIGKAEKTFADNGTEIVGYAGVIAGKPATEPSFDLDLGRRHPTTVVTPATAKNTHDWLTEYDYEQYLERVASDDDLCSVLNKIIEENPGIAACDARVKMRDALLAREEKNAELVPPLPETSLSETTMEKVFPSSFDYGKIIHIARMSYFDTLIDRVLPREEVDPMTTSVVIEAQNLLTIWQAEEWPLDTDLRRWLRRKFESALNRLPKSGNHNDERSVLAGYLEGAVERLQDTYEEAVEAEIRGGQRSE